MKQTATITSIVDTAIPIEQNGIELRLLAARIADKAEKKKEKKEKR